MEQHTATAAVLGMPELLEAIVFQASPDDIMPLRLVCKKFDLTIISSTTILQALIFPTKPTPEVPYVPNTIGTAEYFVLDTDPRQALKDNHICSLQYPLPNTAQPHLYFHLHLEKTPTSIFPPLSIRQREMKLLPRATSHLIKVTNWSLLAPYISADGMWTMFDIHVKACSINDLASLTEKIGRGLQVLSKQQIDAAVASGSWRSHLTQNQRGLLVNGGELKVGYGHFWNVLSNEYYGF